MNEIDSWYIQVQQGNLHITAGTSYTITFRAKASQAKKINVSIQQDFEPYTCYTTQYYILSTIWQQYTFTYTPTITQTNLLAFNLAYGSVGQVWIDNVSFTSGTSGNLIQNPSFENTGTNWLSPWGFLVYQPTTTSSTLTNFLTAIEDPTKYIAGDLFWQLYGHDELQGYDNGDSYTLHYPGDTTDMQNSAQQLRSHTYKIKMGGLPVPAARTPDAPYLHEVTMANAGANIDWRGSVPSVSYIIERSIDNINWQVIGSGITDNNTPGLIPQ